MYKDEIIKYYEQIIIKYWFTIHSLDNLAIDDMVWELAKDKYEEKINEKINEYFDNK